MITETTLTPPQNVNFEVVVQWFEKCKQSAERQGKKESAILWHDGLEWLKYWHQEATK